MVSGRLFERIIGRTTEYAHAYDRLAVQTTYLSLRAKSSSPRLKKVRVADNAAYLRMRARVHDDWQRLSILHRH